MQSLNSLGLRASKKDVGVHRGVSFESRGGSIHGHRDRAQRPRLDLEECCFGVWGLGLVKHVVVLFTTLEYAPPYKLGRAPMSDM